MCWSASAAAVLGGAAVSEHPFGPDYTVTSLSYVVSLLPPALVRDLDWPGTAITCSRRARTSRPGRTAATCSLPEDPGQRHAEIAKFSAADAAAYDRYEAHLAALGQVLGPMLDEIPPRLGLAAPGRPVAAGTAAAPPARARRARRGGRHPAAHRQHRRPDRGVLLQRRHAGLLSVSGVIGTWAGPRSAGTAYVMLHHHIGGVDGQPGAWGFPRGGMGGVTAALAGAARSFGAEMRTGAEVARSAPGRPGAGRTPAG